MRPFLATLCLSLTVFISARAQPFYGVVYRPPGVHYDVLTTEHFRIIYQRELRALAIRVAAVAEKAYPEVEARAGLRRPFHLPIVLNAYNDASNGFVSPLPFRMELDASPIKGKILNPREEDWIAQVVPHELAHAAQAEIRGGFGVGDFVRLFSSDWARALNFGVPRGLTEGLAVSYESAGPGRLGRLNYAFTRMQVRAAAATDPWTMSQVFDPPAFTRPFDRYYTGGGTLYDFLADSMRSDFFVNSARFYNRWPMLGFGVALWQATGRPTWKLSRRFVAFSNGMAGTSNGSDRVASSRVLTDRKGLACRRPKWGDNRTLIAYCSGYNMDRGLYQIDVASGSLSLLARRTVTEDYYLSLNALRHEVVFSEYQPLPFTPNALRSRLERVDMATGAASTIPGSNGLYAPVRMPDGSLLAVTDIGESTQIVQLDSAGIRTDVPVQDNLRILELHRLGPGKILQLANRRGHQALYVFSPNAGSEAHPRPLLSAVNGSIYDPDVAADGTAVAFSSDAGGSANVYFLDLGSGSVRRLTDAPFGAFEPSVSPDGRQVAYVNYVDEQYQVVVQPLDAVDIPADSRFVFRGSDTSPRPAIGLHSDSADLSDKKAAPYRAFPAFLRPRSFLPVVRFPKSKLSEHDSRLGYGFGAAVSGTDALQQWAYSLTGFYQENRLWGRMSLQTGTNVLRPFVEISDVPRSSVRNVGGSTARLPYEERSVEVGASLPVSVPGGTRHTSFVLGGSTEYRSIRFLDSEAHALSDFDDRLTINGLFALGYEITANPRDLIPNSGVALVSRAEVDAKTEAVVVPSREWRTEASFFPPVFRKSSRRFKISLGVLWKNAGSTKDFETYLPRGYDSEDVYLGSGAFMKAGAEILQPVFWVDRGLVLIPVSLQAVYLYGFTESVGRSLNWHDAHSSAGAGVGLRILAVHHLGIDLRFGVARLLDDGKWAATYR